MAAKKHRQKKISGRTASKRRGATEAFGPRGDSIAGAGGLNFPRPLVAVDLAIFVVREGELCMLLVNRPDAPAEPYPGQPALPGGFVDIVKDVDLPACAERKLREKTGIETAYLEQVGSWGDATRDPRGWSTTHVYFALIPFVGDLVDECSVWVPVRQVNERYGLAFDHNQLLKAAVARLRSKVEYTSLPAYLMEPPFTIPQLQRVYEVVLDRVLDKSSFRTRTLSAGYLEESGLLKTDAPRPAMGYRIKAKQPLVYFPRPLKSGQ